MAHGVVEMLRYRSHC